GFRDMIQTLNKVARQAKAEKDSARVSAAEYRPPQSASAHQAVNDQAAQPEMVETETERPRPRIFAVPPPPQASFDKRGAEPSGEPPPPSSGAADTETDLSQADLIEKLMSDDQTSSP
ncbi:MAG TPA: hypothetical protein VNA16_07600, partial [Abditibacteriaceae bacterium]|nr:hypothetical protein [Abditibacteriaceae bacterium]